MSKDFVISALEVTLILFLLIRFVPRDKIRVAQCAFFFKQFITWPVGLIVAEFKLIEYPFRLLAYATKASFLFEFFLYPAICALFIVNFPEKKSILHKWGYYFGFCTVLTIIEVIEERYTDILEYIKWNWVVTWISFIITFFLARKYSQWFFKNIKTVKSSRGSNPPQD